MKRIPTSVTNAGAQSAPCVPGSADLSHAGYAFLQKYIHLESGLVIDADKRYLLQARLQPLLRENNIGSLEELSSRLASRSSPSLGQMVVEAMTTNETHFFRDPLMFEALLDKVLPAMFARARGRRKVRIWSAAASSGQEAYTVAMLILEMGFGAADVEIIGTDISNQILEQARAGRYVPFEVGRGLPAAYLAKYFTRRGAAWQIHENVRAMVRFEQLDLRQSFRGLGVFDVVLCRNVLIYLDTETKRRIVDAIRKAMAPEALLVLGCAETIINIHEGFERTMIGHSAFYSLCL